MELTGSRRRGLAIVAVGIVGMTAAAGYALADPRDAAGPSATPTEVGPLPSEAKYLDTSAIAAQGTVGDWRFVLAPGVGSLAKPNVLCLATGGPENSGSLLCSYAEEFESKGSFVIQTEGGPREIWGIAPVGTTKVEVGGVTLANDGRFFKGVAPSQARSIDFVTSTDTKSLPIRG